MSYLGETDDGRCPVMWPVLPTVARDFPDACDHFCHLMGGHDGPHYCCTADGGELAEP